MAEQPVDIRIVDKVPAWARAFGVLALVAAIAAFLVPFVGVIFITIPAAILGIIALSGGDRKLGMTVFIIVAVNIIISPSFWLNLWAGSANQGLSQNPNMLFAILDILSGLAMVPFLFIKRK
jgi:hypothetical protein